MFELYKPTLGELFSNPEKFFSPLSSRTVDVYKYCVPPFQRKYEWEKEKEIGPLINDISSTINQQYFIGPMILYPTENANVVNIEIIDGQQRLVTLALYFRAFADYLQSRIDDGSFSELPEKDLNEIRLLKADAHRMIIRRNEDKPIISLSDVITKDFEKILLDEDPQKVTTLSSRKKKGEHVSIKNLRVCYLKIHEHITENFRKYKGIQLYQNLYKLFHHLDNDLRIAVIKVGSYSDAYTMYETMNAKGKRLTLSDLAKIVVFQKLAPDKDSPEVKDLEENWDKSEAKIKDFSSFIWHVWVSSQPSCPKKDVFHEMDIHFTSLSKENAKEYIYDTVLYEVDWYYEYENPNEIDVTPKGNIIRKEYLEMLKTMGASRCYPLLLSIDYCLNRQILDTDLTNELLQKLVCLTFWHNGICELDAKPLESLYHDLALYLRQQPQKEINKAAFLHVMSKLSDKFPTEERCQGTIVVKNFEDDAFTKMVLRKIENNKYRDKEKALRSNSVVWLEHILPKNPKKDSEWKKIFPEDYYREDQCTRLGNCTLLLGSTDIKLSNKEFDDKKPEYKLSQVGITREIEGYDKWNAESIKKRTQTLATTVEEIWPIV